MLPRKIIPDKETDYDNVTLIIQNWIYFWIKDNCETRSEFLYSKRGLKTFLDYQYVLNKLGSVFIGSVMLYLKKAVELLENSFCFYLKKTIRHYGAYINCGHEGSNNAIKNCASKVTPVHKIENALQIIVHGSERTMLEKSRNILQSSTKTQTRYYNDVYQSLDTYAAAKLEEIVEFSSNLQSVKFNQA